VASEKVSASLLKLDVNTGTVAAPTWVQVGGLADVSPESSSETDDATDRDSATGWTQNRVTTRGQAISFAGQYLVDPITGVRDVGQAKVAASSKTTAGQTDHILQYRIRKTWAAGGAITFLAFVVSLSELHGGPKELAKFEGSLELTEPPVEA
jgi:hypothetical protein